MSCCGLQTRSLGIEMVCDVCKEGDAVIQLTRSRAAGYASCISASSARRSAGSRRRRHAPKPQLGDFLQTVHQQMQATQGDAARCTVLLVDLPRLSVDRPAGLRALLRRFRERACASCCGACTATRDTSGAAIEPPPQR